MFGLFRKSVLSGGILEGYTDVHCHVLPGVDDGIQHTSSALEVLKYYEEQGVRRVFFTPHIAEELHENTRERLEQRLRELRSHYKGSLELGLGAEYMIDEGFSQMLDRGEDFLCASPGTLLVETIAGQPPMDLDQILYELQQRSYTIMLAHPERYIYMQEDDYQKLVNKGIRLQLNLLSLVGLYGEGAQKKAQRLLREGLYTYVGSDLHNLRCHAANFERKCLRNSEVEAVKRLVENNNKLATRQTE